jgi:hypothetical protein
MRVTCGFFASLVAALLGFASCTPMIDFGTPNVSSPGGVTGMDHILLTVSDISRSVAFYRDVMGMRMEYRSLHFAMLRAGNYGVALSSRPWPFEKKGEDVRDPQARVSKYFAPAASPCALRRPEPLGHAKRQMRLRL